MPNYKVVDADQLDADLKSVADSIRAKAGVEGDLEWPAGYKAAIEGITGSGGASDDVRYVTFMSHDRSVEYGKKAVAVGDDCADPIARGIFTTPTRESDAGYNYTFAGWATTANGGLDNDALKTVTEDRTLYANYIATARSYTITYYDSDGTTVLKTVTNAAYGSMPATYTPSKSQHSFNGWVPEVTVVTGDASYTAQWIEHVMFSGGNWADIAEICANGEAAKYFSVGNERQIPMTINGTEYQFTAKIVGMNHDDLADGSGKAPLSILFFTRMPETKPWEQTSATESCYTDSGNEIRGYVESYGKKLPDELKAVIKKVTKETNKMHGSDAVTFECSYWLPSVKEVYPYSASGVVGRENGKTYSFFSYPLGTSLVAKNHVLDETGAPANSTNLWMRDGAYNYKQACYMQSGSPKMANGTEFKHFVFGFCI